MYHFLSINSIQNDDQQNGGNNSSDVETTTATTQKNGTSSATGAKSSIDTGTYIHTNAYICVLGNVAAMLFYANILWKSIKIKIFNCGF